MQNSNPQLQQVVAQLLEAGKGKLPPQLARQLRKYADPQHVALEDLMIRSKDAKLVPLKPNSVQKTLLNAWEETYKGFSAQQGNWHALYGARETILKARQGGVSTLIEAIAYILATTTPHFVALIVADKQERAELLFEMIRRFHANDHRHLKVARENVRAIFFKELDSSIRVTTARDPEAGRAATINFLHMSELAFWNENWNVRGALLDSVPLETGIIIEETTANGVNQFYEHWQATVAGQTYFHARFIPWYTLPEYSLKLPAPPTEEELEVMQQYSVNLDQARWYVIKRREKSTTDVPVEQEYPGTAEESFIATATGNVFPVEYLKELAAKTPTPIQKKKPGDDGFGGYCEIYKEPSPTHYYVIGADVAEGIDDRGDHDYSTMDVFDAYTWEHVASYWGRPDVERFAYDLSAVSSYYNNALIIVERNNHGHAVCMALDHMGANVYVHKSSPNFPGIMGFPTNAKTKAHRDDALKTALIDSDDPLVINNKRAIGELMTYCELPGKKRGAVGRAHDDHVSSIGMAIWYLQEFLPKVAPVRLDKQSGWKGYTPYWSKK